MKILFLYSRLNGFVISTLKALSANNNVDAITVVHRDDSSNGNQFQTEAVDKVTFLQRQDLNYYQLIHLMRKFQPDIVYLSGWVDATYLAVTYGYRQKNNCLTVVGIDDQWRNTFRQIIGSIFYKLVFRYRIFDYMWVAGPRQYYYARRFGHNDSNIIFNLLSADTEIFNKCTTEFNKRFVYVGRFDECKGILELIEAYKALPAEVREDWRLTLIGAGGLSKVINDQIVCEKNIDIIGFCQPSDLKEELSTGGVGCLVSSFEQWGVSLHEYACMGMPIIATKNVGSASEFVIDGFNGVILDDNRASSVNEALTLIASLSQDQCKKMSKASSILSNKINPEHSAMSLLSITKKVNI